MTPRNAPNFFILGAAKCGTTTLADVLRRHPEIYIPRIKETQFFSIDESFERGLDHYLQRHFRSAAPFRARGEATPHYLAWEKVARRIRETLPPDAHRFIAIFRDPVARAYSLYQNMVHEGVETLGFEEALEAEARRLKDPELEATGSLRYQYFSGGLYAQQLRAYFEYFPSSRFLLLFQEDLRADPDRVFASIYEHLGLRRMEAAEVQRSNPAGMPRSRVVQRFIREPHWIKEPFKKLVPWTVKQSLVRVALGWNKRVADYAPMDPGTEDLLRERFRDDILDLERITGRDLSHWRSHQRESVTR